MRGTGIFSVASKLYQHGAFYNCSLQNVYIGRKLYNENYGSDGTCAIFEKQNIKHLTIGSFVTEITFDSFIGSTIHDEPITIGNVQTLEISPSKEPICCRFSRFSYTYQYSLSAINPETLLLGRELNALNEYNNSVSLSNNVFLDRCSNLTTLDIGEDVTTLNGLQLDNNEKLSLIMARGTIPPIINSMPAFRRNTYLFCNVKVPKGSLSQYQSHPVWATFWNIEECDFTSSIIDGVADNGDSVFISAENGSICVLGKDANKLVRVFTTQGTKIAETCEDMIPNLSHGVYIVTVGTKSFKVSL